MSNRESKLLPINVQYVTTFVGNNANHRMCTIIQTDCLKIKKIKFAFQWKRIVRLEWWCWVISTYECSLQYVLE
jgi:hypothetical protein